MKNAAIDANKTLYISCDSSQICGSYIVFQIDSEGSVKMVGTSTRIFIRGSRNKCSAWREILAIVMAVVDFEAVIRSHQGSVILLSDSIRL